MKIECSILPAGEVRPKLRLPQSAVSSPRAIVMPREKTVPGEEVAPAAPAVRISETCPLMRALPQVRTAKEKRQTTRSSCLPFRSTVDRLIGDIQNRGTVSPPLIVIIASKTFGSMFSDTNRTEPSISMT